ncbi:MAG: tetratricopeptide repeat protein [Bacteroidales bacterium]|nr:tetratricopeptide repeat protein [Bacteroidales bacterium]
MKISVIILLSMVFLPLSYGQKERSYNRTGVKNYNLGEYNNAEVDFMKALEVDSTAFAANYNTAATLYKLEKYGEANEILAKLANNIESPQHLPDMLHNLGNNFLKQDMYEQSIEAYKNSLRLRPSDDESRYNLAYAQAKLKQQQEENKDDQKQDQDNKDQDDQEDKKEDQQEQQNEENKEQQQQQPEPKELSKEDVERILQAIQEQEKDVKEKVDKEKAKVQKVKTEKDW